ncbi:MAG: FAD/NAD(P)-binding protein, partial [Pseudomonadota bacterium]
MKSKDRDLGMDCSITRRDVLHGFGAAAASAFVPGTVWADRLLRNTQYYPPGLTGLRGDHDGSFEVAHALAREGKTKWGTPKQDPSGQYDLVVVGAGISGLAAAYFYKKERPNARILILDNHDDFGGHAKRNEFYVSGKTVLGYGGSQTLEAPSDYNAITKSLLAELGVDIHRFDEAYDNKFYKNHGLAGAVFFGADRWGQNRLVPYDLVQYGAYVPLADSKLTVEQAVAQMPISDAARGEMLRLLTTKSDQMSSVNSDYKEDYLYSISYRTFLERHLDITEPDVFKVFQDLTTDSSVGIESTTAGAALLYVG